MNQRGALLLGIQTIESSYCGYRQAVSVQYLKNAGKEDIGEVGINDLQLPGGVVRVVVQELVDNSGQTGGRHF